MDFRQFIESERKRLSGALQTLEKQRDDLEEQIGKLNLELSAIDAYEAAKEGRVPVPRKRAGARRSGIREEVMRVIRGHQAGISRADLLEKMGVKGDRSAEQSVSNALAAGKKKGELTANNGMYRAIPV